MRLLVDAQLPPAQAGWLTAKGFSSSAPRDEGLRDSNDSSIRNFALAGGWVLATKDDDFAEQSLRGEPSPPIAWLRNGNCTNRVLFAWLEPLWPDLVERLASGQRIVEIRKASGRNP